MYRNGNPFQIRGASGDGHLRALKRAGGNTLRVYEPRLLASLLDEAHALDIAIVADLPLPSAGGSGDVYADSAAVGALVDTVRAIVRQHAGHPALLCWMLGNEVFGEGSGAAFAKTFRTLVDTVRASDPDHPITTSVIPRVLAAHAWGIDDLGLDFVSLNMFGNLKDFRERKRWLTPLWNGPYLISEWGTDGPWEVGQTSWGAPLEPSSAKRAEQTREQYRAHVDGIDDGRCLGSLAFYWGDKQERTHTWFSLFDESGRASEAATVLGDVWGGASGRYAGPGIAYLLLEGEGARADLMFPPGVAVEAHAVMRAYDTLSTRLSWEIRPEDWYGGDVRGVERSSAGDELLRTAPSTATARRFTTPLQEGPYRLFAKAVDTSGYYATANIPFQVLSGARAD